MMRFSGGLFSFPWALIDRFDQLNELYDGYREGLKSGILQAFSGAFSGAFTPEICDNFVM